MKKTSDQTETEQITGYLKRCGFLVVRNVRNFKVDRFRRTRKYRTVCARRGHSVCHSGSGESSLFAVGLQVESVFSNRMH